MSTLDDREKKRGEELLVKGRVKGLKVR